ncbi:MAG: DUF6152 family protein, partial [Steroidobacteraceae bacterium]
MKMTHGKRSALITLTALLTVGPAYAHHSALGTYDHNKPIKLTGVVVKYEMHSPHVHIMMDVKNSAGGVEHWIVESGAVGSMLRMGLSQDKLKPGDTITVIADANRDPERHMVWMNQITTAGGAVFGGTFQQLVEATQGKRVTSLAHAGDIGIRKLAGRWEEHFDFKRFETPKSPLSLTAAGLEAVKKYDPRHSPGLTCEPPSLPWMLDMPYVQELKVGDKEVILHHEVTDIVRTVPLDGKPHKADKAGQFGLVSGRVEGGTLVVDSSGYPASAWGLAGAGTPLSGLADIPSSTQKKVTERYSASEDGNTLTIAYTVSDPVYLTQPYSGTVTLFRLPDNTPMSFKCDLGSANAYL